MRKLALTLTLLAGALSACTTTSFVETADEIRITGGHGGQMRGTAIAYNSMIAKKKKVVIDGHVISADAYFAFAMPNACYTENAVFSPHAVSYLGLVPARDLTEQMTDLLPEPLANWFRNHHSYYDWFGFPEVGYDQLIEIWPEGACKDA